MFRQKTIYCPESIEADLATGLYFELQESIEWEEGVRSRNGFTRKALAIDLVEYPLLGNVVARILNNITTQQYEIMGTYLNYYQNGEMYTPNHSHKQTSQLVVSLGATRTLTVGKKSYQLNNGDSILFGSSVHGVPKEPSVTEGRISIATFMIPIPN